MILRVIIFLLILCTLPSWADTIQPSIHSMTPPITQPQNISFENCTKMFAIGKDKLFYLTLGAITANKFSIEEIQSHNGYIIFTGGGNKYLATIAEIDSTNSILKITPCNNIYFFPSGILINMFKYVELNLNTEIK